MKQLFLFVLLIALPMTGSAVKWKNSQFKYGDDETLEGTVAFSDEHRMGLLKGSVKIWVYQDQQARQLIGFYRIPKDVDKRGPFVFILDPSVRVDPQKRWEKPFFLRATFEGGDKMADDAPTVVGKVKKQSFLLGPLQGGERGIKLLID